MKSAWFWLLAGLLAAAASCPAGQTAPGAGGTIIRTMGAHDAENDTSMLEKLIEELGSRRQMTLPNGAVTAVNPADVGLCRTCGQPLYLHTVEGFKCLPMDDEGNPIQYLETQYVPHVPCPVCKKTFTGALPGGVNSRAGLDRDLCAHSIGKNSVHSQVWCCPDCGYAALAPRPRSAGKNQPEQVYADDFRLGWDGQPVSEAVKAFVREKLSAPMRARMTKEAGLKGARPRAELAEFGAYVEQAQIPDWLKYENALRIYDIPLAGTGPKPLKPPHVLMAKLYTEAAHACRREVCAEVAAPYLEAQLQESLGRSITSMNRYVQATCQGLRRIRGDTYVDPSRAETDPRMLVRACYNIARAARENASQFQAGMNTGDMRRRQHWFSNADLFVMNLTYAGAMDRLGSSEEAGKILATALKYVPEKLTEPVENKDLEAAINSQLGLLRGIVSERQACLRLEQEFMIAAARHTHAAIRFGEVKLMDYRKGYDEKSDLRECDPAPTAYLLGELCRRSGDRESLDGAVAWFLAADPIIEKRLAILDAVEAAQPKVEKVQVIQAGQRPKLTPLQKERQRLVVLQNWTREQRLLIKTKTKAPDPRDQEVIDKVLNAAAVSADKVVDFAASANPETAAPAAPVSLGAPTAAAPAAPVAPVLPPSQIKTREELYNLYYQALTRYRAEKQANPTLKELVKAGYIRLEDAHLDEAQGKVLCPESGEALIYMRSWNPDEKNKPILVSTKEGAKCLFPGPEIREWKR